MHPKDLRIEEFDYLLPEDRIARFPSDRRDGSKLLYFNQGQISNRSFDQLTEILTRNDLLVLNKTKVIPARLQFQKSTGANIEIFCLEPISQDHQGALASGGRSEWKCYIGGAKKWREGKLIKQFQIGLQEAQISAEKKSDANGSFQVNFEWLPNTISFSEILLAIGELPLPPYFGRSADVYDHERYQTVFAEFEGSVAAPTAGLHFTDDLLLRLKENEILQENITLHVGAGTFKPVTSDSMEGHEMHSEVFSVSIDLIERIKAQPEKRIIPVGTTCMRTIESLYWLGVKLSLNHFMNGQPLFIDQWDPYSIQTNFTVSQSMDALLEYARTNKVSLLSGSTAIMIAPGYTFKIAGGLITNFHMPKSTLILLVAALIGNDWKKVYQSAMANDYRFLSYGDSSLLIPSKG